MPGTLYLLPNLISAGDPRDSIPQTVLEKTRRIRCFLVEAAKTARATLKAYGHPGPISELRIEEIGHDPDFSKIDSWLAPVLAGEDCAVLSESGCPGIADPGAQIVSRAHELGIRVVPWVGPSSIFLTLMASGLDGQRFRFIGYFPIEADARKKAILDAEKKSSKSETQLAIETPYRNTQLLNALVETLHPETRLTAAVDVTGADESIRTMKVADWRRIPETERTLPKLPTVFAFLAQYCGEALRYTPNEASASVKTERKTAHVQVKSRRARSGAAPSGRQRQPRGRFES